MRVTSRRGFFIAVVLTGCFVWAMVIVGLSFAMLEHGNHQWWVVPLFGIGMAAVAAVAAHRVPDPSRAGPAPAGPGATRTAPPATRALPESLSPREIEVLQQLAAGRSNREIAAALYVAPGTVKAHLSHIFRKLDAGSRLQAVAHAREAGLLDSAAE